MFREVIGATASTYKLFNGVYCDVMPRLAAEGLVPTSVRLEMERRVAVRGTPNERGVWGRCCDTGDGIVASRTGAVKIRLQSPDLQDVRRGMPLVDYGIGHTDAAYERIEAAEISLERVARTFNRHLSPAEVVAHEGWLQIVNDDTALLRAYRDALFSLRKELGHTREKGMGLWTPRPTPGAPVERALWIGRLSPSDCSYQGGILASGLVYAARLAGVQPAPTPPPPSHRKSLRL